MSESTAMSKLIKELNELQNDFSKKSDVNSIASATLEIAINKALRLAIQERKDLIEAYNEGMSHFADPVEYPNLAKFYYEHKFGNQSNS